MRENEFEQKVQEQLDELHLRPSASVWYQVEKELRRKKKRRVVFYFSILAGLGLLGYLGITLFSDQPAPLYGKQDQVAPPGKQVPGHSHQQQQQPASPSAIAVPSDEATANTEKQIIVKNTSGQAANNSSVEATATDKAVYTYKPAKTGTKDQLIIAQTAPSVQKMIVDEQVKKNKSERVTAVTDQQLRATADTGKAVAKNEENEKQADLPAVKKDSAIAKTSPDSYPEQQSEEVVAATTKKPKDKKIRWGFDVSAGVNFSRDKALALPQSNLVFADFNQSLNSGGVSSPVLGAGPYASPPMRQPSPVEAGRAFKAGVTAEIKMTEKSSILASLRYAYLSETIKVGRYADTVIASSYAGVTNNFDNVREVRAYYGPQMSTYRNNYHFIELPVSYQLQLTKGKKMQLLWNGGASVSYLFSTNALVYDTAARGIYYKSNDAFNKLHISFLSGLSLRFGEKKKLQWSIGPEFSMDMTGLLKHNVILEKRYLLYGGVTARVLLPGKKK